MARIFCQKCGGSKKILGGGMTESDCRICDEDGRVEINEQNKVIEIDKPAYDKRSRAYKDAIIELQEIHPDLSRKDVQKLFDERYNEI